MRRLLLLATMLLSLLVVPSAASADPVGNSAYDPVLTALAKDPNSGFPAGYSPVKEAEEALQNTAHPGKQGLWRRILSIRQKIGSMPKLPLAGQILAGAGTFELGWKIGRGIDQKFLHLTEPAPSAGSCCASIGWTWHDSSTVGSQRLWTQLLSTMSAVDPCSTTLCKVQAPGKDAQGETGRWVLGTTFVPNLYYEDPSTGFRQLDRAYDQCKLANEAASSPPHPACTISVMANDLELAAWQTEVAAMDGVHVKPWANYVRYSPAGEFFKPLKQFSFWRTNASMLGAIRGKVKVEPWTGSAAQNAALDTTNTITLPSDATLLTKLREELDKAENEDVRDWVNSQLDPDNYEPPFVVRVPSCRGLTYTECVVELEKQGWGGTATRQWLDFETADVTLPARSVVQTRPAPGTVIDGDADLVIKTNPAPEDMPVLVPEIASGTRESDARRTLEDAGLQVQTQVVTEADPHVGPSEVISVDPLTPSPGTRVHQGSEVTLKVNPSTAPSPGSSGGGACGMSPPSTSLDLTPISDAQLGNKVPFSLVAWVPQQLSGVATAAERPNVTFSVFGVTADLAWLENFDGLVSVLRGVLALLLWLGAAWFLYGRTIGRGT